MVSGNFVHLTIPCFDGHTKLMHNFLILKEYLQIISQWIIESPSASILMNMQMLEIEAQWLKGFKVENYLF